MDNGKQIRILALSAVWQGANDYAFVRAFRRTGHSVRVVSESESFPGWRGTGLRVVQKLLHRQIASDYNRRIVQEAINHRAELIFVFKGPLVTAGTLRTLRSMGCIAIQFYPDVSFRSHGPQLAKALKEYDWVFTTKSFGLGDMQEQLNVTNASFVPHAYDPETHKPVETTQEEANYYGSEVSFIGNSSRKKRALLEYVQKELPNVTISIWGPGVWANEMPTAYRDQPVLGLEYAKAIACSKINMAPLHERVQGASSGDRMTARTFEIPAAGGFMLHERTDEAMRYFEDGRECAFYADSTDLVAKIRYFLDHPEERRKIAKAGRERCLNSGYSVDDRVNTVLEKYYELRSVQANEVQ